MHQMLKKNRGFTLIELLVVIAIVAILGSLISITFSATVTGGFSVSPPTIPAGAGSTFTYKVTKSWAGSARPEVGRNISFRVAPAGTVITVNPASGNTDALGEVIVTVTPHADYRGGANIWAKDVKSGKEDSPVGFTVQ